MGRLRRISVSAANIRCHKKHAPIQYQRLIQKLGQMKASIPVYGDTHILMYEPRRHTAHSFTGVLAKYTRIDMEREWIDLVKRDYATDSQLKQIRIPPNLAPHGDLLRYFLYPEQHLFIFQTYSRGAQLSPALIETYFHRAAGHPEIEEEFGPVDVTIVPTRQSIERIFGISKLTRLTIFIRRPNADHLSTADSVYERLKEQNAEAVKEEYVAEKQRSIAPDPITRELAEVARDNGYVSGSGRDEDGSRVEESTEEHPLSLTARFSPDNETELSVLDRLGEAVRNDWEERQQ